MNFVALTKRKIQKERQRPDASSTTMYASVPNFSNGLKNDFLQKKMIFVTICPYLRLLLGLNNVHFQFLPLDCNQYVNK